ncbi:MAG TPA: DNA modification methylase [Candidatus Paceibacterota bacterium]|nr:DNA modification methylase [Candidatus Paceibacterota bacterium]
MAKKLFWSTVERTVNDLVPHDENPRRISSKQLEDLKRNIERFNLAEIPAINSDGRILAGHQRIKALQLLGRGEEKIPVRIPSRQLSEAEARRYLVASNALGGSWDFEKLKAFDAKLLMDIGVDDAVIAAAWDSTLETQDDGFDVEKEIARIKKPKSKVGEVYQLGPHRLAVGDATDPSVLKKLFGSERASMVYSDPIYNLSIDYSRGVGGRANYGGEVNDTRTPDEYRAFLKQSMEAALAVTKDDAHVFYWNDESQIGLVQGLFAELGLTNRRVCLWIKNGQNPTPGVAFSKAYEPCIYATRGKPHLTKNITNLNEVLNKEIGTGNRLIEDIIDHFNVWLVKRLAGKEYTHATAKPPTLHQKAIRRCTKVNDIILDSFSGSGSTLISAEMLKRRAYVVELEPLFADLTIRRWEALTKLKAKRV